MILKSNFHRTFGLRIASAMTVTSFAVKVIASAMTVTSFAVKRDGLPCHWTV